MSNTFYKVLIRERGRLRSYNDTRIVWYDEDVWVRDTYPLFVFDTFNNAKQMFSFGLTINSKMEMWKVECENPRQMKYGPAGESIDDFWFRHRELQYLREYELPSISCPVLMNNELPYGTYICDSLRLIERVL